MFSRRIALSGLALIPAMSVGEARPLHGSAPNAGTGIFTGTFMAQGASASTPTLAGWIGFGKGDLTTAQHLAGSYLGQTCQVQQDSETYWNDGSVRTARVAFTLPFTLPSGSMISVNFSSVSGAPNRTAFITPAAMAAAKDYKLQVSGGEAGGTYTSSFRDIITNAVRDTWGVNPLQGWEVVASGPVEVLIRAWTFRKSGSAFHRWNRDTLYVSAFANGDYDVAMRMDQGNWDGAATGATAGPTTQTRVAAYCELFSGATRLYAWGGPNDPRVTTVAVSSLSSGGVIALPGGFQDYTALEFAAASGDTLPTGLTANTTYFFAQQRLYAQRRGISDGTPLASFSGGSGNMIVTPRVVSFYGSGILLVGTDGFPIRDGAARPVITVGWDEAYMSLRAKLFPPYNQSATRFTSAQATSVYAPPSGVVPNAEPLGPWLNTVGDDPGDPRIGYVDYFSQLWLLSPHDLGFRALSLWLGCGWSDQPMWWRDQRTGRMMVADQGPDNAGASYPQLGAPRPTVLSFNGGSSQGWLGKTGGSGSDNDYSGYFDGYSSAMMDGSHLPCPWVVPAHLTGHPMFTDMGPMQANAATMYAYQTRPVVGGVTQYTVITLDQQIRGVGWTLRSWSQADMFTAAALPETAYIKNILDRTSLWCTAYIASETSGNKAIGRLTPWKEDVVFNVSQTQAWMGDIMMIAMGMEAWRGERAGFATYLSTAANYTLGVLNDASGSGGSSFFLTAGHFTAFVDGVGAAWTSIRALIAGNATYSNLSAPYPTTRLCNTDGGGTFDTLFETNGGWPFGTTDYGVVRRCNVEMMRLAGIASTNGDDPNTIWASINTRFATSPLTGITWANAVSSTSHWVGPRSVLVWAMETP